MTGGDSDSPRRRRSARHAAMDLLARREHSRAELRDKLAARDYDSTEIDEALDRLTGEGLANDGRFVTAYVASRMRRGYGPIRIRAELHERHVAAGLIANALGEVDDWHARAREVRERRFGAGQPADFAERAKQSRFLEYRGFTTDQIRTAFTVEDDAG